MIPPDSLSIQLPHRAATIIRRAEINNLEGVCDAVWKLAHVSAMAAHWSRAAFYPYVAEETVGGALQAKALFVACRVATARPSPIPHQDISPTVEQVVGFAAFSAVMTDGTGESTLENMAVGASLQKQGIGGRLLSAGLLWCRAHAVRSVFLEVRETNQAAIALYDRASFSVIGRRPAYYSEPVEDALQMQKLLDLVAPAG